MACCGEKRRALQTQVRKSRQRRLIEDGSLTASTAARIIPGRSKTTTFEYVGKTAMAVTCSESGRRYHFASPGARVEVDSRDVHLLASVSNLRMHTR